MSVLIDHGVPTSTATAARAVEAPVAIRRTATFQCLVLSVSHSRRQLLSQAATDAGWDAVVCADTSNCWNSLRQEMYQLVLLDLQETAEKRDEFRELAEHLAGQRGMLLALCGNEGDAMEEIWARQIGAWLYLPGVEHGCDISSLCGEAKPVAEKLSKGEPRRTT